MHENNGGVSFPKALVADWGWFFDETCKSRKRNFLEKNGSSRLLCLHEIAIDYMIVIGNNQPSYN